MRHSEFPLSPRFLLLVTAFDTFRLSRTDVNTTSCRVRKKGGTEDIRFPLYPRPSKKKRPVRL